MALYGHRHVTIEAIDGDSGRPLPGATVYVSPQSKLTLNPPHIVSAITNESGVASFPVATFSPMYWRFSAPGYEVYDDVVDSEFLPQEVQ
ncbi:MAG: carboxypeptidase regulatory-like domain-containing protein, partial [Phycisphaerae bacterium]|nr:carboxypeptidase regulatory-like domain-containing protein [Phycisphaerae bacterium]